MIQSRQNNAVLAARLGSLLSALFLTSLACGNGEVKCASTRCDAGDIAVASWWECSDSCPGQIFQNSAQSQPYVQEVHWSARIKTPEGSAEIADEEGIVSSAGEEVDVFLANGGWDVRRWTRCSRGEVDEEQLEPLSEFYDFGRHAVFDGLINSGVMCQGEHYAVPVAIHRVNHVLARRQILADCDSSQVSGYVEFGVFLGCLTAALGGAPAILVPLDTAPPETEPPEPVPPDIGDEVQFLVENMLLLAGGAASQEFWSDADQASMEANSRGTLSQHLRKALDEIARHAEAGRIRFSTEETRRSVAAKVDCGEAGMLIMPDWYLSDNDLINFEEIAGLPFPGTGNSFLFTSDVFAIPKKAETGPEGRQAGLRWLDELLDPKLQREFAVRKRAYPALQAAYTGRLPFSSPPTGLVPALEGLVPLDPATLRLGLARWANCGNEHGWAPEDMKVKEPSQGGSEVVQSECAAYVVEIERELCLSAAPTAERAATFSPLLSVGQEGASQGRRWCETD